MCSAYERQLGYLMLNENAEFRGSLHLAYLACGRASAGPNGGMAHFIWGKSAPLLLYVNTIPSIMEIVEVKIALVPMEETKQLHFHSSIKPRISLR
ncbi:hypothetical protein VNO77_07919 [Canavalia gladiata]|uniref:Uncharacterized protein n=1 Tax=Canavalia gladiata TaxID=3824 RepID=A0AAN9R0U1_CANGL